MPLTCDDRDRIFADGTLAEWAALEAHALSCANCAEELRAWKSISTAASQLRDYGDSPSLWPRIERALVAESSRQTASSAASSWRAWLHTFTFSWRPAAAVFSLLLLAMGAWLYQHGPRNPSTSDAHNPLLRSRALSEVERTESAYVQAIEKLAEEAKPQLDRPETPLLSSYREKLLVLDSAIDDLRAQAGMNPSNAHLRRQLLAMYQEKQRTLEEVLEARR